MTFEREITFLKQLSDDLEAAFDRETARALLVTAAAELFAGPKGIAAMFDRDQPSGKQIPAHLRRMPK